MASENEVVAERAQELLSTPRFRCYRTTDVIGGRATPACARAGTMASLLIVGCNAREAAWCVANPSEPSRLPPHAGVELGGALKNVLAIACGVSDGLGFGSNGRAALITRGLDEITRLAGEEGRPHVGV